MSAGDMKTAKLGMFYVSGSATHKAIGAKDALDDVARVIQGLFATCERLPKTPVFKINGEEVDVERAVLQELGEHVQRQLGLGTNNEETFSIGMNKGVVQNSD